MQRTMLVMTIGVSAAIGLSAQTFTKDVAPILQLHCQTCHRPGEAAPFSLLTYEQARPWAKAIRSAVLQKKMPPWYADPQFGKLTQDPVNCFALQSVRGSNSPEQDRVDLYAPEPSLDS